ncbi:DUF3830 family protein [archaeon]|nr:DUF3830 family protein [archaeon]
MMLKITIGEHVFKAKLHTEKAPETCRLLMEKMPITGKAIQAHWSGEAAWLQMDPYGVEAPQENATSYPGPGQLLYYPGGVSEKEILIPYGSAIFASKFGLLPGNHFATIVEGVEFLEKMGEMVLWKGAQDIKLEV